MKVWLMWIPNSKAGQSIALSPIPPIKKGNYYYFNGKGEQSSCGFSHQNGHGDIFDFLFKNYFEYDMSEKEIIEIEL